MSRIIGARAVTAGEVAELLGLKLCGKSFREAASDDKVAKAVIIQAECSKKAIIFLKSISIMPEGKVLPLTVCA